MATAIEFNHVGKQYRLGLVSTGTISHDLNRWWQTAILRREDPYLKIGSVNDRTAKADSDYVWALRDIDFKVEQGDVVGIIGKNGAGKSTLLKLLSKVTGPTVGTIRARGRIASLLEVGTGFHQEMTGRENIFMNGAILGMTKAEIAAKLDEIVDFSGCERYLDTPVKRYSSGMMVRLGFAVAAHLDPEILVVDEVLAVGDAEFQKKAIGKMQDVSNGEGRTVLFVSHNMASVKSLCKSGLLLENGGVVFRGTAEETVNKYVSEQLSGLQIDRQGSGDVVFSDYSMKNDRLALGEDLQIQFTIKVLKDVYSPLNIEFTIHSEENEPIANITNQDVGLVFSHLCAGTEIPLKCTLKNINITPGGYYITLYMGTMQTIHDWIKYSLHFSVEQGNQFISRPVVYSSKYPIAIQSKWENM